MAMDIETARRRLLDLRAEVLADLAPAEADTAPVKLDQDSVGRLSPIDAMQMQEMALAAKQRRRTEIDRIDAALRRVDTEEFGYCAQCGDAIAEGRLETAPFVTTCIQCASA